MIRKNLILAGIILALLLLFVATLYYPGGSQSNPISVGYNWGNNYLSNLFSPKAVNGADNLSRPWAVAGMLFLSASFGWFFIKFSVNMPSKRSAAIVKYCGAGALIAAFLAVTPLHDPMMPIASTLALVAVFYITAFLFKSKLHFLKLLSVICLLLFYACVYIYFTRTDLNILPVMQKLSLLVDILWVLSLEYFAGKPALIRDLKTGRVIRSF